MVDLAEPERQAREQEAGAASMIYRSVERAAPGLQARPIRAAAAAAVVAALAVVRVLFWVLEGLAAREAAVLRADRGRPP
jgi:hypothetical protein